MRFILDLWPDLEDDAPPEDLVRWAVDCISMNPGLRWDIVGDDGAVMAEDVIAAPDPRSGGWISDASARKLLAARSAQNEVTEP